MTRGFDWNEASAATFGEQNDNIAAEWVDASLTERVAIDSRDYGFLWWTEQRVDHRIWYAAGYRGDGTASGRCPAVTGRLHLSCYLNRLPLCYLELPRSLRRILVTIAKID